MVIKKAVLANDLAKSGRKSEQKYREKVSRVRGIPCSCSRRKTTGSSKNLTSRLHHCGDLQIIEMGYFKIEELAMDMPKLLARQCCS